MTDDESTNVQFFAIWQRIPKTAFVLVALMLTDLDP